MGGDPDPPLPRYPRPCKRADLRALELDRCAQVVWEAELVRANGTEYDVKINAPTGKTVSKTIDD